MIEITNVTKRYGNGREVLSGLSLSVTPGKLVTIFGASGAGKSTLLQIIGGLDRRFTGTVSVAGYALNTLSDAQLSRLRGRHIGFVFQSPPFLDHLTAYDNLKLAARFAGGATSRDAIGALLLRFDLQDLAQRLPRELSGGQLQRLGLARALVGNPALLLGDEPTGNLDGDNATHVMRTLSALAGNGHTILIVTHDRRFLSVSDEAYTLAEGRLVPTELASCHA